MALLIVYLSHPDEATAQNISDTLIEEGLAACANIFPMKSSFIWQGEHEHGDEFVSLLKTRPELGDALEQRIIELHPYEVPCVLRLGGRANAEYEDWINTNTHSE